MSDTARLPARDVVVVHHILQRQAGLRPSAPCVVFQDGTQWNFAEALDAGRRAATALAARGLRRGDRALIQLPNGPDWLRAWWGVSLLGAVIVPVNTAYRGEMLRHVCTDAAASNGSSLSISIISRTSQCRYRTPSGSSRGFTMSAINTVSPWDTSSAARWVPMKPDPPKIIVFTAFPSLGK